MTEPPVRAAVYLRISRDIKGDGLGVDRQREDCMRLCADLGWVAEVYEENDASAYKSRPVFQRLLRDIKAGRVDAIVTWQPDRLYRGFADLETIVKAIEDHGVVVRTVKAGDLNLDSAYGRMIARMLSVIAQGEGELKAERWKRSWRQGRERGEVARTGSRLFGYTRDGQVVPHEAEVARRMVADIIGGGTILGVGRWLEAEGILTTRGKVWRTGTIRQYLENPRIAGFSTLDGDIVADGKWEPLIDRDTWETVRALLKSRTRGYIPRVALLNGLLFCGRCGERMVTSKNGKHRSYRCPSPRPGFNGCGRVSGKAEPIEEVVESYARTRLADQRVRDRLHRLRNASSPDLLNEIAASEARLRELETSLDEPGVPVATILRAIDRTKERLEEQHRQLSAGTPVAVPATADEWPTDLERRRALVDLVVEKVTLDPWRADGPRTRFDPERVKIQRRD